MTPKTLQRSLTIDYWQRPDLSWKKQLRRIERQCKAQEHMMTDLTEIHDQIFKVFQQAGAVFDPDPKTLRTKQI